PKGIQQPHPPIMVGGKGRTRTLKTLAKYGDIMNVIAGPEELRELIGVLEGHCEAIGRDPAEIRKTVHVPMRIERDEDKARELRDGMDWRMIGPPGYVIDRARDFIEAGTEEFMLQMIPNKPAVYEELDAEVLRAFD
ncbi:MAG: LLM class flavin-dependent oxidoreductase, partial [Gammaproteobacteria bacterium]|nr:LLM class flavin-dependent oxidoreductase [Gammaproteobacteria bacterium]